MYRYAEESVIGYQLNDPFVDDLVYKIRNLRHVVSDESAKDATAECKAICDLINARFGDILEEFEVEYVDYLNACMAVPVLFKIGVRFTSGGKEWTDIKKEWRKNGEESGWREAIDQFRPLKNHLLGINFKEAKIENGIKEGCKLSVTLGALISDTSDRSLAGLVLHEIGHLFHHYALSISNVFTNTILVETAKQLALNDDPLIKIEIISRVNDEFFDRKTPLEDVEELAQDETNRNAILRLAYAGHRYIRSELGFDFYDSRSHEQVADKFAVRFGLAGDLAEIFSDLMFSQDINGFLLTGYFSLWFSAAVGGIVGSVAVAGGVAAGLGGLILLTAIFGKPPKYQMYDGAEERIKMLRIDFISALKKKQMDKETVSYVIKQLDSIEASLVRYEKKLSVHDRVDRMADRLVAYFNGTLREETINKDLERMANNELFVATKRLGLN